MKLRLRRTLPHRTLPHRHWFRYADGTYYRNCPLIASERDEVLAWPLLTPGKGAAFEALSAEWWETFRRGVQEKDQLSPGDVVAEPAPMRDVYPDNPGLWALDDRGPVKPPPDWLREKLPPWRWNPAR